MIVGDSSKLLNFLGIGRLAYMRNSPNRLVVMFAGLALVAATCGTDVPDSAQAAPEAVIEESVSNDTSAVVASTTETTVVEALAFADEKAPQTDNQLWTDVTSASVSTAIEFEFDPTLEITGGFTGGEGVTLRWQDAREGDVLAMFRGDGVVLRAFRVGNEVFIGQDLRATEEVFNPLFFGEMIAAVIQPLETGELPTSASTFEVIDGVAAEMPDVFYELVPGETEGRIFVGPDWLVEVEDLGSSVRFEIPDENLMMTREEVGQFDNLSLIHI